MEEKNGDPKPPSVTNLEKIKIVPKPNLSNPSKNEQIRVSMPNKRLTPPSKTMNAAKRNRPPQYQNTILESFYSEGMDNTDVELDAVTVVSACDSPKVISIELSGIVKPGYCTLTPEKTANYLSALPINSSRRRADSSLALETVAETEVIGEESPAAAASR